MRRIVATLVLISFLFPHGALLAQSAPPPDRSPQGAAPPEGPPPGAELQEGPPPGPPCPCADPLFLQLKTRPLEKMTEREFLYFMQKDEECAESTLGHPGAFMMMGNRPGRGMGQPGAPMMMGNRPGRGMGQPGAPMMMGNRPGCGMGRPDAPKMMEGQLREENEGPDALVITENEDQPRCGKGGSDAPRVVMIRRSEKGDGDAPMMMEGRCMKGEAEAPMMAGPGRCREKRPNCAVMEKPRCHEKRGCGNGWLWGIAGAVIGGAAATAIVLLATDNDHGHHDPRPAWEMGD